MAFCKFLHINLIAMTISYKIFIQNQNVLAVYKTNIVPTEEVLMSVYVDLDRFSNLII